MGALIPPVAVDPVTRRALPPAVAAAVGTAAGVAAGIPVLTAGAAAMLATVTARPLFTAGSQAPHG